MALGTPRYRGHLLNSPLLVMARNSKCNGLLECGCCALASSLLEDLEEGVRVAGEDVRVLPEEERAAEADAVREEEPVEVERLVAHDA